MVNVIDCERFTESVTMNFWAVLDSPCPIFCPLFTKQVVPKIRNSVINLGNTWKKEKIMGDIPLI